MTLKVGITSGIGSGKSTVAKIFGVLGVPVYYADDASKRIMNSDADVMKAIIEKFGEQAYPGGKLDRSYLASKVFNNASQLAVLNSIVHPATIADSDNWLLAQHAPYIIKEAALLFESGSYASLDYVIGVWSPYPLRLQRVLNRDNVTREQVIARMDKQIDERIKMKLCDFVIDNSEEKLLIPQVLHLHNLLLSKAS